MHCPPAIKINCYKSLIIPILEYACTFWSSGYQKDIYNKEMVQRRAARFIFNNYSYDTSDCSYLILDTLNGPTLQRRRLNHDVQNNN